MTNTKPVAAIFNDTTPTNHHGCNAVMQTLVRGLSAAGVEVRHFWPVATDWHPHADAIAKLGFDTLVVNGEGTIHDSAERERARHLCELGPFARDRLGVPAHLINASIGALRAAEIEALKAFDAVWVRESESLAYCEANGIAASLAPDLSFGTPLGEPLPRSDDVVVTDSVFAEATEALKIAARENGATFETMRVGGRSFLDRMKRSLAKRLNMFPMTDTLGTTSDYTAFIERLSRSRAVVTGRFHTVTLCLLTRTPFLAVTSNTRKIEANLIDALGGEDRIIAMADVSSGAAFRRIEAEIGFSDSEAETLDAYLARVPATFETMFASVARGAKT